MIKSAMNQSMAPLPANLTLTGKIPDFNAVGRLLEAQSSVKTNSETKEQRVSEPFKADQLKLEKTGSALPNMALHELDEAPVNLLQTKLKADPLENIPVPTPRPDHALSSVIPAANLNPLAQAAEALKSGQNPGAPGPYTVTKIEMDLGGNDVDIYLPSGPGPFPVNIYSPGLSHGQHNARANANHFASWGMVTVVPSLGGNLNPVNSGRIVERIVDDVIQRSSLNGVVLNSDALAVSGHSFGGLTASLAADHPSVKALLALDPNDNLFQLNPGRKNAPKVDIPAAFVFGDGGPNDLGPGIFNQLASTEKYALRLKNMPHLNFASTSEFPDKLGQQRALDFGTAFLLNQLGQLSGTAPYLPGGTEILKAQQAGELIDF